MEGDEKERRKKLDFLREHYIPIVDYSLEEQSQKGMHEASKKLRLLKRILLNDNELPDMSFLNKSEAILKKLDSRQKAKPEERPRVIIPVAATADDECQVIGVKKVEQKRISTECPRSPSPDSEPRPCLAPTLIPIEKQKSLLDLPMPDCGDDDEPTPIHHAGFQRQMPPQYQHRPTLHQNTLPNPIARLIEGVHNSTISQPLRPPPMPPFFCSSDTDLRFPCSSDDIDMREAPLETFEPSNFEEVPSPPRLELDLKSDDDDDDLIIDESHTSPKETEKLKQLPPPTEPLKPPPRPPSSINLGQTELESLAQTAPSAGREKPQELEMRGPADDFIPGRQISRVPSSLMASKTGTITMPSPRPMASPRPRPSSVRIPQSPAYDPHDLFTPDALIPKYQFNSQPQRPVQVCAPVSRQPEPAPRMPHEMQPPPVPVSLPDFLPPSSVSFQPPQRPAISPQWGQNRDPRAANQQDFIRDPRRLAQERQMPEQQQRPAKYGAPPQVNHDPRLQGRSQGRPVAIVPSVDRQGQYVPSSYKEHKRLKELEKRQQAELRKKKNQELSLLEKKNKEQEEKRRKEAEERSLKHNEDKANTDRIQKMNDIVKLKVQSKPTSKVQCIEPLPLPPSEMKKKRRGSDERRSSTDSEGSAQKEKNADKSLEKVSPLGTLYGEMPQPSKTSVFRIPKKPKPKQSSPRSKRSPTPPSSKRSQSSSSASDDDMDDTPPLRYDSSEEEAEKAEEQQVAKPDSTETDTSSAKDSDTAPMSKEALAEAIRSTLMSMGFSRPDEKKAEEETVAKKPDEPAAGSDITNMIRSLVQEEIKKIHLNKSEPEVSSSSVVIEAEAASKAPVVVEPETADDSCTPDQSHADSPKENVEQMFSDSDASEDDSKAASAQIELRNHLKKAVRIAVRKSELDKLQDDLRESFISDGVLGAVGPRAKNPIERFSAENRPRRSRRNVEEQPVEKAEEQDADLIDVNRQPVVKLMRLPEKKKPQKAKRGRVIGSMGRPPSVSTTPDLTAAASEASDNEQSEQCPSSIASDDTTVSDLSSELAPTRGSVSERGSARGRGRGGRRGTRSNRPPEAYPSREIVTDVTSPLYVWEDGKIMPCKLCTYEGKKLVEHYVYKHPDVEVLISRLDRKEAMQAMVQKKSKQSAVLQCRFCPGNFNKMSEFQDHVSEHTGEYKYSCMLCQYIKPKNSTVVQHLKSAHSSTQPPELIGKLIECKPYYLPGFMCGFCNFVQISKEAVVDHVEKRHRQESGAACTPGLEEVNEINMVKVVTVDEVVRAPPSALSIKLEALEAVPPVSEETQARDDHSFMSMLNDLIQDKPQDQQTGKSFLESIRKSKTNESDETVKRIEIPQMNLPPSTPRQAMQRELSPPPPPPPVVKAVVESPSPEKEGSRKRKNAIVGICYACGHTEGEDVNNLFQHIRVFHTAETKGNCPDCSRPLSGTDKAIKHMIEEHVQVSSRQALLDYWKPVLLAKSKKLNPAETQEPHNSIVVPVADIVIPLAEQPMAPQHAKIVKNSAVYASMLEPGRLRKLYKCMGRNCSFSSDVPEKFVKHIDHHKAISMGRIKDWQECVYCMELFGSGRELLEHFHSEHNKFVFQCCQCFYRSASESNVHFHQKVGHPGISLKILLCQKDQPKSDMPSYSAVIGNLIKPYVCNNGCTDKSFYRAEAFMDHLKVDHSILDVLTCHVCPFTAASSEDLVKHYEGHSYLEFNCLLCTFGAENQIKLHNHLCVKHPNYSPCLAARSLLGLKTERNLLVGALRGLESKLQPFYQPPIESDASDSDDGDEEMSLLSNEVMPPSPTAVIPAPIFSRTLSAIAMSQCAPSTSSSLFSRVEKSIAHVEKSPAPVVASSSASAAQIPAEEEKVQEVPVGPPPVTRPLSTFSRMSVDKEKPSTSGPPPVTQPLSTFARTASAVELEENSKLNLDGHQLYICCNPGCDHTCEAGSEFGDHLMICAFSNSLIALFCVHCNKTIKTIPGLVTHLKEIHGPPRFTCGVCQVFKSSSSAKVQVHLKLFHAVFRTVNKAKNAFKTDANNDEFFINPKVDPPPRPVTGKSGNIKKFSPGQEEFLPTTHIFPNDVFCALCDFKTRVRTNILRHLKDHGTRGTEASSSAIPINPTPTLKTGEKHFDKMLNWAKSSQDGTLVAPERRKSQDLPEEDVMKMPIFVAAPSRYVCGVPECWYKSSDVSMLQLHLENLHDGATEFNCSHCLDQSWLNESPDLSLFDRSVYHMKQHGPNLFICLLCRFAEASRKDMEKHFLEEHKDESQQMQVIREIEPEDGATWCCSECKFTCFNMEDIKEHSASLHEITDQFRCSNCVFRALTPDLIFQHNFKEHTGKAFRVFASFYPIGFHDPRVIVGQPTLALGELDKTRHIRQIRIEEVGPSEKKQPEKKLPARKSDWTLDDLIIEFGPMGSPDGQFLVCPKCKLFKNRQQSRFRDHMFREFEFKKYTCNLCTINVVSKSSLQNHLQKIHKIDGDFSAHILFNESRPELETFVNEMIKHQFKLMPQEMTTIIDPLAMDDELVVPKAPIPETATQVSNGFEETPMEVDEAGSSTSYPQLKIYNESPSKRKKSLNKAGTNICKHCNESFKTTMALKMHIKLLHYKAGKFICDYCDVSATSENIIVKHSLKQHPDLEPCPKPNPNADKFVFDEAFWDRDYGIYRTRDGVKMRPECVPEVEQPAAESNHDCQHCTFKTAHASALKRHTVTHKFTYGCGLCDNFESGHSAEVREHSAIVHPDQECDVKQILQDRPAKVRKLDESAKTPVVQAAQPPAASPSPPASPTLLKPKPEDREPAESPAPSVDSQTPSSSTGQRPPASYGCKYCNMVADRLKVVYQHWEETHKLDGKKFLFAQVLGKKCRHCNAVVSGEKDMKDHFKLLHPEFVTISFQIYLCDKCTYRSDMLAETVAHLSDQHQHTGPTQGYTVQSEAVRGNKQLWCLCVLCHSFSCTGEKQLTKHSEQVHPGIPPKYIMLNNKGQRLVRELGFQDKQSGNMRVQAVHPTVASLVKTEGAGGARRMYLCPEVSCGVKTKTLKGMEEHVRQAHVVRMQCGDCDQIFVNDIAAKMHHLVEHKEPDSPSAVANLFKVEVDVQTMMLKVRREGDPAPTEALAKTEPN